MGAVFGFKANAVRVAVTRLVADGLLESDERGCYRLGAAASALSEHAESWRKGEARMGPWKGRWLTAVLPPKPDRTARRASLGALGRLGMREGMPGLWVRPDNLRVNFDGFVERLQAFGLEPQAEVFVADRLGERLVQRLTCDLWPLASLERSYRASLCKLEASLPRLEQLPQQRALLESFVLGGEAIQVLATDPLLPEQMLPAATRARLTEAMRSYDEVGRRLWRRFAVQPELSLVKGGSRAG